MTNEKDTQVRMDKFAEDLNLYMERMRSVLKMPSASLTEMVTEMEDGGTRSQKVWNAIRNLGHVLDMPGSNLFDMLNEVRQLKKPKRGGLLIAIEGLDAAGKNTQAHLLATRVKEAGVSDVTVYSFPQYKTSLGKAILAHLTGDSRVVNKAGETSEHSDRMFQCMMSVDRYVVAPEIRRKLDSGGVVICDRWKYSAVAYGSSDGLSPDWLRLIQKSLPEADLNLFIQIPEEEALRRRPDLRDRYERNREKQAAVGAIYAEIWKKNSFIAPREWVVIDGVGDPDHVSARIGAALALYQLSTLR